ncbi:MAG TPA: VWA domain-containing protein [Thermoanaerobaculia bacterium]|nr:VWA domain-containing protein [Thermoanaerobaculia bacterium]
MPHPLSLARPAAALLLTVTCLLAAPGGSSQEHDVLESFGESLDVVVVGVEAVVTDRDGNRVPGLEREDFRLLVDGRETPIAYFSEVREGREVVAGGEVAEEAAPAPGEPATTNHLVFIDDYFGIRNYRNTVLKGVRDRLSSLPAGDRMAIVAFDGEEIDVLAAWTTSRDELARCFDRALKRPANGLFRAHERRRRGEEGPWTDDLVRERELDRVLSAVRSTLRILPRPEGRKVLLLLGGGWPIRSPGSLTGSGNPGSEQAAGESWSLTFDDRALVGAMADAANLLGYTVYPVDLHGLRSGGADVEQEAPRVDALGLAEASSAPHTVELLRQGTLRYLADETGGRALFFSDRTQALDTVLADIRSYYSLGFTPPLRGTGRRHGVRLEVRRPGLQVRARSGYRDLSQEAELDLLVEAALRFDVAGDGEPAGSAPGGAPDADASPLTVTLGEPRRQPGRTMQVFLRLEVPWRELTFLPSGGSLVSRLEVRVAARDRKGELSEMARVPFNVVHESPPDPDSILRWGSDVTLRRERHALVVSLYDAVSGKALTQRVDVEP